MKTSLLTSVYKKNSSEELNRCFNSIKNQAHIPDEIILVIDGPVEESVFFDIKNWNPKENANPSLCSPCSQASAVRWVVKINFASLDPL